MNNEIHEIKNFIDDIEKLDIGSYMKFAKRGVNYQIWT